MQEANVGLKQSQEELREFERLTANRASNDGYVCFDHQRTESVEDGFKKLALSISEMILQQIIANQVVAPLMMQSLRVLPPVAAELLRVNKLGNVFEDGSIRRFAYGGIVNRPIEFPMAVVAVDSWAKQDRKQFSRFNETQADDSVLLRLVWRTENGERQHDGQHTGRGFIQAIEISDPQQRFAADREVSDGVPRRTFPHGHFVRFIRSGSQHEDVSLASG